MAAWKYNILYVYLTLNFLCSVFCELNLNEDEPCVTEGVNGTCVRINRCVSASVTYDYANAGFDLNTYNLPELPDICSYKNDEPVVCCTDCYNPKTEFHPSAIGPFGVKHHTVESIAWQKCFQYFGRLPYPCRGVGNIHIKKTWIEDMKCHSTSLSVSLATGGRNAQRWEFPHGALIGYGDDVDSAQWLCGGSVISERFILTAAHCTSTHALGNITFAALGLLKRTDPKEYWKIYKIKRIIIHPDYKAPSKYHDIALLETETEINFGKDLLPACLVLGTKDKRSAEASGWGKLGNDQALADTLQVVNLVEYSATECAGIYKPHRHLINGYDHEKQMCYGRHDEKIDTCEVIRGPYGCLRWSFEERTTQICVDLSSQCKHLSVIVKLDSEQKELNDTTNNTKEYGDSGGPLQTNMFKCLYDIVGVTSYGKSCGILGSAGMYTRVSYYVPWIEGIVWPEETELQRKKDQQWLQDWLGAKQ